MRRLFVFLPLSFMFAAGCTTDRATDTSRETTLGATAAARVDYAGLAERLATQSARIREGDKVLIEGSPRDLELLEDLAVEARARGASPLVTLSTDRMMRLMYDKVPAKYDTVVPEFTLAITDMIDVYFAIESGESDKLLAGVPAERLAARRQAFAPIMQTAVKRGLRLVYLGNGLYPTEEAAQRYGMSKAQLAEVFWKGVNVDYDRLQATGETVRRQLASGEEVRITNPNGTDLRVKIGGGPVNVSDGVISPEDERRGGSQTSVWLPAGEVYFAPVPNSAEGTVVADRHYVEGGLVEGLRLEFKGGKLTKMTAKAGVDRLQALYDAAGTGKDRFAFVDIGINPNVTIPEGSKLVGWMPGGMVTVGVGENVWAGGSNAANFSLSAFLPGSTLTVDGVTLVKDGKLQRVGEQMATR